MKYIYIILFPVFIVLHYTIKILKNIRLDFKAYKIIVNKINKKSIFK